MLLPLCLRKNQMIKNTVGKKPNSKFVIRQEFHYEDGSIVYGRERGSWNYEMRNKVGYFHLHSTARCSLIPMLGPPSMMSSIYITQAEGISVSVSYPIHCHSASVSYSLQVDPLVIGPLNSINYKKKFLC